MALLFGDGFDHYDVSQIWGKWDAAFGGGLGASMDIHTNYGRLGSKGLHALRMGPGKNLYASNAGWGFMGAAFYIPVWLPAPRAFMAVCDPAVDGGIASFGVCIQTDGSFQFYSTDVVGGFFPRYAPSAPGLVPAGTWMHMEFGVKSHNTNGAAIARLNGVEVLNVSGVNTRWSGTNNYHRRVMINGGFDGCFFDDFYYCDDQGPRNNNFLGDVRLGAIYPNGVGSSSLWTPVGAASGWEATKEHVPDDDVSYVWSTTPGDDDLYEMDDTIATTTGIKGLLINTRIRKDDATARTYATLVKPSGAAVSEVAIRSVPGGYVNQQDVSEINPVTGTFWTKAQVDAMQAGIRVKT